MAQTAQTIRLVTYNTQGDESSPSPSAVIPNLAIPIEGIGEENFVGDNITQLPDIIGLEETTSNGTTCLPLCNTLNTFYNANVYTYSTYQATQSGAANSGNGPNALIYNQLTMNLMASVGVGTPQGSGNGEFRQVVRYQFQPLADKGTNNGVFYVYVCHAKSLADGTVSTDQQEQEEEAAIIRGNEATLPANSAVMYVGDWNVDASTDPSMVEMSSSGQGQAFDPYNPTWSSEDWATTSKYQGIMSESDNDLRYRDDLQLVTSNVLNDGPGSPDYIAGSLHSFANNGSVAEGQNINQTGNTSLNDLPSNANPTRSQILTAMNKSVGSDHLPVVADYSLLIGATWSASTGGSWSTATDWAVSSIAQQAGVNANFINSITAPATISLDAQWTVGTVNINSTNAYTFTSGSGGSLTLSAGTAGSPAVNVFSGSHTLGAPVILTSSTLLNISPSTSTLTVSGNVSGTGGFTMSGSGTASLSGSNSYTGGNQVLTGTLQAESPTALGNANNSLKLSGGILDLNGNAIAIGALSGAGTVDNLNIGSTATFTVGSDGSSSTFVGTIQNTGGNVNLVKTGAGNLVLAGSNTYAGGTTISGGTLTISAAGALPSGSAVVNNANLVVNANSTISSLTGSTGVTTIGNGSTPATLALTGTNVVNIQSAILINGGTSAGSALDIGDNALVLPDNGSPATIETAIQQYIVSGQTAGSTSGAIISTFVTNNSSTYGIAYADGSDAGVLNTNLQPGQVVIEPDIIGDADMNGTVNFHDLQNLLGGFGNAGFWDQGNFNNHATVDFNDLQLLLGNFGGSTTLSYSELQGIEKLVGEFGYNATPNASGIGFTLTSVPEPATLALVAAGGALLVGRRRRRLLS